MNSRDIIKQAKVFLQFAKENGFYSSYVLSFCAQKKTSTHLFRSVFFANAIIQGSQMTSVTWRDFYTKIILSFDASNDEVMGKDYWEKIGKIIAKPQNAKRYG